ncbi:MAG: hypothetical protein P8X51_13890 [Maritimibacter sp.]
MSDRSRCRRAVTAFPHPDARLVNGEPSYMFRDAQDTVIMVTNAAGAPAEHRRYHPFGEVVNYDKDITLPDERKGWIGERYDAGAGLFGRGIGLPDRYLIPPQSQRAVLRPETRDVHPA